MSLFFFSSWYDRKIECKVLAMRFMVARAFQGISASVYSVTRPGRFLCPVVYGQSGMM